ncbi:DUF6372 family protein [Streptomyces sp. 5-10]|uniref:DUF6372 family protein n=1 Tax=Streptomyces sp. 5-10 TaxID=878925 RepID=UPI001CC2F9BC
MRQFPRRDQGALLTDPADKPEHPVLYLTKTWLFTWEQHRPGGCRCICRLYHDGQGACTTAAEPGHLLRVVTPGASGQGYEADITDALPVCTHCYAALAPLSEPPTGPTPGGAG